MSPETSIKGSWGGKTWIVIALLSIVWWSIVGQGSLGRAVLIASLGLSSFMVGCLIGFLFSSYGEESSTLGKIRDWLIGGITALTVAKAATLKEVLRVFSFGPGPTEFALAFGVAVAYASLGFFFMFFQRELILNVLLAQSRAQRGKLEGSQQAGQVIQHFLARLPLTLLTGIDYIDEIVDVNQDEATRLRELLYADDVEMFLKQADDAVVSGNVDWDIASKAAYILYYRTYFEKDNRSLVERALQWTTRALNMNPLHVDLTMKYADLLGAQEEYEAAVSVLERLQLRAEAPVVVKQWLGFYLRFNEERLDDAIKYSDEYHMLFPEETDSFFNSAYAYFQKYCKELRVQGIKESLESQNRLRGLARLSDGLRDQPEMKPKVAKWVEDPKGPVCLRQDTQFRELTDLADQSANPAGTPTS